MTNHSSLKQPAGNDPQHHFAGAGKMITLGKGGRAGHTGLASVFLGELPKPATQRFVSKGRPAGARTARKICASQEENGSSVVAEAGRIKSKV